MTTEIEYAEWDVEGLKPNPLQSEYFTPLSEDELYALAEAIKRNGMDPIDVLPDGTILSGHQRRLVALMILAWKKVPVRIRHDLLAKGADAAEQFFLDANTARRRMTIMQTVRAYERGKELEAIRRKSDGGKATGRIRDVVAKRLGMKARKLEDWKKLLNAPMTVQRAVDEGRMTLADGLRVVNASPEQQQRIATAIDHGATPKKAVKDVLGCIQRQPLDAKAYERRWKNVVRTARELMQGLSDSRDALQPHQLRALTWLFKLVESLKDVREEATARATQSEKEGAEIMAKFKVSVAGGNIEQPDRAVGEVKPTKSTSLGRRPAMPELFYAGRPIV